MSILWDEASKRCKRGHLWAEHEEWYRHSNGNEYRRCKACIRERVTKRYKEDETFREKQKKASLDNYHAKKSVVRSVS